MLDEFARVVSRSKLAARLALRDVTPEKLVARLRREALQIVPRALAPPNDLRDQKDLHVLEAAVNAEVEAIVTGDDDLLLMKSFAGIPILSVRETLELLGIMPG